MRSGTILDGGTDSIQGTIHVLLWTLTFEFRPIPNIAADFECLPIAKPFQVNQPANEGKRLRV